MPVSSSSSRMPNCEIASTMLFCSGVDGNSACCGVGPEQAEHRRPEQEAGEQLAHHGRLADALHGLAEQPPRHHQHHQLGDEDRLRGALVAFGRQRRGGDQQEKRSRREGGRRPSAHSRYEIVGGSHWCLRLKPQAPIWFHLGFIAHVLVGEPASTSPGHARVSRGGATSPDPEAFA